MADPEMRLLRIEQAHQQLADAHGVTSGYCIECELIWPCPSYRWATEDGVTIMCSWDLDDCAFEEHNHVPEG